VAQIDTTIDARVELNRVPGLRARVHEDLLGILESALEMRLLRPNWFADGQAPLLAQVDGYEISYSLDVGAKSVTVLSVLPVLALATEATGGAIVLPFTPPERPPGPSQTSAIEGVPGSRVPA